MSFPISCAPDHYLRATPAPGTNITPISQAAKQGSKELKKPLWDTAESELKQLTPELGPFSQTNTHSLWSVSRTPLSPQASLLVGQLARCPPSFLSSLSRARKTDDDYRGEGLSGLRAGG